MSDLAIRVEHLGKRYRLGEREPYKAFRDILAHAVSTPFRALGSALRGPRAPTARPTDQFIWALKDVSFEITRGEVVGIIGRNGVGKTTLLKILSRVTKPTEGRAQVWGRVGSLLEVGTGFHPELTGRENIFLNGAILGMKKREIRAKFDAIVAFAELERFVDTPVKRYSSGMYMRLAFSVAAHLEPDILLVDEVLAVGDAAFQKKCLGKMGEVAKEGRTVLLVSHHMATILSLCGRAMLFENGRLAATGATSDVVGGYLTAAIPAAALHDRRHHQGEGSGKIRFTDFAVSDERGHPWLVPNRAAIFRMKLELSVPGLHSSRVAVAIGVSNGSGERLLELHTKFDQAFQRQDCMLPTTATVVCTTKQFPLRPGVYYLTLYVDYGNDLCDRIRDGVRVEVRESDYFGTGASLSPTQGWLMLEQDWRYEA